MAFQHKIDARVDVAGKRVYRRGHLLTGGDHRAKPLLQGLLEIPQPAKPKRLNGTYHGGVRGV